MSLSKTQRRMLLRLADRDHHGWRMPADGRKAQGWKRTLWSLSKRGLVEWLYAPSLPDLKSQATCPVCGIATTGPGWCITQAGLDLVQETT